jgi:hypothetical protein
MPKVVLMAQLSRPYQIALGALVLLAAVWLLALRPHSSSTTGSGSPAVAPSPSPAATGAVVHGSAPGVEGLAKDVAKAHGAVTTSQQNAKQLEEKSAQVSGGSPSSASTAKASAPASSSAVSSAATTTASKGAAASNSATASKPLHKAASAPAAGAGSAIPSNQRSVEAELKQGKIVLLLFWSPKGADDVLVQKELKLLANIHGKAQKVSAAERPLLERVDKFFALELNKKIAVHYASASQVTSFGSITHGVQVYGTPTILVLNRQGQVTTLTGFTDAYAIEQAIEEARHA